MSTFGWYSHICIYNEHIYICSDLYQHLSDIRRSVSIMSTCTVGSDLDLHLADIRRFVFIMSTSMFTDLYQHLVDIRTSVSLMSTYMFIDLYRHPADILYVCICNEHIDRKLKFISVTAPADGCLSI